MKQFILFTMANLLAMVLFSQKPVLHVASTPERVFKAEFIANTPYFYTLQQNSLKIWNIYNGVELEKLDIVGVKGAAVSKDGSQIAVLGQKTISLYSLKDGRLREFGNDSTYVAIKFSKDKDLLAFNNRKVERWTTSGQMDKSIEVNIQQQGWWNKKKIFSYLDLLSDGKTLVLEQSMFLDSPFRIYIWNYVSNNFDEYGRNVKGADGYGGSFDVSKDEKYLAYFGELVFKVIDLNNRKEVLSVITSSQPTTIKISDDSKRILVNDKSGKIIIWDILTGKQLSSHVLFGGTLLYYHNIVSDSINNYLAWGPGPVLAENVLGSYGFIGVQNFSGFGGKFKTQRDRKSLFISRHGKGTFSWDIESCRSQVAWKEGDKRDSIWYKPMEGVLKVERKQSSIYDLNTSSKYFLKNGFKIIITTKPRRFNEPLKKLEIIDQRNQLLATDSIESWHLLEDGTKLLFTKPFSERIEVLDIAKNQVIKKYKSKQGVYPCILSDDKKFIQAGNQFLDFMTWEKLPVPNGYKIGYSSFLEDGKSVIFQPNDNSLNFIDIRTGHEYKKLRGKLGKIESFEYLNDSIFITAFDDGFRFWNLKSEKELANLMVLDSVNWVVTTPEGLFDATPGAMNEVGGMARMYYVVTDTADRNELYKVININQLKQRYYQPGLLSILLGFKKEPLREVPALGKIEFPSSVKLSLENDNLSIELANKGGGIGKVSVFVEGSEILEDARQSAQKGEQDHQKLTIDLRQYKSKFSADQLNAIKVVAWNNQEWLSSEPAYIGYKPIPSQSKGAAIEVEAAPKKEVSFYAVVVGTSDYSGDRIDLKFASKDAQDFYSAMKNSSEQLFPKGKANLQLLTTDLPGTSPQYPSKKNIVNALKALAKTEPQDAMVLYFSGHGVNYGGQDGDFYYLTHQCTGADAGYLKDQAARENFTISSKELTKLLNDIPARKKVLILDACASGKAAEVMVSTSRDVPASQVRSLDRLSERTGFYVLSGSAADAVSYETSIYGQGLLTYSLLKAIRGASLRVDGGEEYVDVQKLLQYAVDEVPNLAKGIGGIQQPLFRSPDSQRSYDIGKVTKEVKDQIKLAEPKPIFVASNFQDENSYEDVVLKFSEAVNSQLREITARGRQAEIVFTEGKDYPNAYRLSGRYKQEGGKLQVTYIIYKGEKKIGGPFTATGDPKNLSAMVAGLMDEVKGKIR
ncbi:MAG: caspase family protein [Bacteroidetes bacterium]|nr:caspase family protein [Bacteroidota bacterium]